MFQSATRIQPRKKIASNLSTRQMQAIRSLARNRSITINKADKGSTIVVQDTKKYIEQGLRHLSDRQTYCELSKDTTKDVAEKVVDSIRAMYQDGVVDKSTAEYLLPPRKVRTQELYFTKKIHKSPHSDRPTVSGCNGPTEKISAYLDHWLQPIVRTLPSYIKDTKTFINFIESTTLPRGCILCTLDVTYLYTNIPTDEGIQVALKALESQSHVDATRPPVSRLSDLLELILQNYVFRFADKFHTQLQGTAMGTKMAPAYANVFMGKLESTILSQPGPTPIVWRRYIDDIFCVWTDTEESLKEFINNINKIHPTIKFTSETSTTEVVFLDLCLYKGERFRREGILDMKTHIKPTNTQQYTHASSGHPPGTEKSIIKGELLRYFRTNSNRDTIERFREKTQNQHNHYRL